MNNKTFVLHDESVNTQGFRMMTTGANLTEFIKNPVMLLNHNDWTLPIGRWENIRIETGKILADPVFDLNDSRGYEVAGKVERNFVRMASIGAWPPDEVSTNPVFMLPNQTLPTVIKWTVREASIVTIGSNHNAIVMYDRNTGKQIELNDSGLISLNGSMIGNVTASELAEFTVMTWNQIDRANKLLTLKTKYYSLYESKFIEKFGKKP